MAASDLKTPSRVGKRKARQAPGKKCLAGDGKKAHARGLCDGCYREAAKRVKAGEITWEELERRGLAASRGNGSKTAIAKKIASLKPRNGRR